MFHWQFLCRFPTAGAFRKPGITLRCSGRIRMRTGRNHWVGNPETGAVSNRHFEAGLVPRKQDDDFYRGFRLEVENLTGSELSIERCAAGG